MKTAKGFCNKYVTLQPLKATNQSPEAKATINSQFGVVVAIVSKFTDIFDSFQHILKRVYKAVLADSFQSIFLLKWLKVIKK